MALVKRRKNNIGDRRREESLKASKSDASNQNDLFKDKSIARSIKNFRFEAKPANFIDGAEYPATIADVIDKEYDNTRSLVVTAEAEDDNGNKESFHKFFELVNTGDSTVYRFCDNFNAVTNQGEINLDALVGKQAVVTLYTSKSGKRYISTIYPVTEAADDCEEEVLEDDADYYPYDNDFTYNDGEDGGCIYES